MPTARIHQSFEFPGYSFSAGNAPIVFDHAAVWEIAIPAVPSTRVGTLTTRTDNDTGVVTLSTGHGITTGMVVDVYWDGGRRYGMDATVASNAVTIDGGDGNNLPTESTEDIVVTPRVAIVPLNIDGDEADVLGVVYQNSGDTGAIGHASLQDAADASIAEMDIVHERANGGLQHVYNFAGGDTNVVTGDPVTKGFVSHDSASAARLVIVVGMDATP